MTDDLEESSDSGVGRLFEDFRPGEVIYHPFGKTVTEADNQMFTLMTQNVARIHLDKHFAARTEFGRPLVNSTFTLALVTGFGHHHTDQSVAGLIRQRDQRSQIRRAETRLGIVDPHQRAQSRRRGSVPLRTQRRDDRIAGGTLVAGGHGVLEIDDHHVGSAGDGLGVAVGTVSRHEQRGHRVRDVVTHRSPSTAGRLDSSGRLRMTGGG